MFAYPSNRTFEKIVHPILVLLLLFVSALAGRQLFMDGTTNVVQSLQNPFWLPSDQDTPRRLFALLFTTTPVRLIGILSPGSFETAKIAYGAVAYLQIWIPLVIVLRSRLELPIRSLLTILFIAGTIFLANFVATELLFALGLTTMFVVYTLAPVDDPKLTKRLVISILLIASYEVVALSNLFLALGIFLSPEPNTIKRRFVIAILLAALPFQLSCHFSEPMPPGQNILNIFVFEIFGIASLGLLTGLLMAKSLERWHAAKAMMIVLCLGIPLLIMIVPDHFTYLRTREFQYAYPSRIFSAAITVVIALLPVMFDRRIWGWPSRWLGWIGARPLANLAAASLVAFYGVSMLASADAFAYWKRLGAELSQFSGLALIEKCKFCTNPQQFGYADLGEISIWPAYSMAYSLEYGHHPRVIVVTKDNLGEFTRDQIAAFLKEEPEFNLD